MKNTYNNLMTLTEVAELLNVKQQTMWSWVYRFKKIEEPEVRINSTRFYTQDQVRRVTQKVKLIKKWWEEGRTQLELSEARGESARQTRLLLAAGILPKPDLHNRKYSDGLFEQAVNIKVHTITEAAAKLGYDRKEFWAQVYRRGTYDQPDLTINGRGYYSDDAFRRLKRAG